MTTNTIPEEAGHILTTFDGEQLFVRPGLLNGTSPVIQLAEGEWDAEEGDFDMFASVYTLTPEDALFLAGALVAAIKEVAPDLVPTQKGA